MSAEAVDRTSLERDILVHAQEKGKGATLLAYLRLSGPGWLQSAITLGGGSLAGSLYLGVVAGFGLLWLQPLFMILGIVMLCAIGYVTMSTSERPFWAICRHVNPVLAWAWALASLAANIVWCLPQFSLALGVFELNLLPQFFSEKTGIGPFYAKVVISAAILVVTVLITWSYGSGHWGLKLYEWMLKLMVATIVVCFFIVVYSLTRSGQLDWAAIGWGFVPDVSRIFRPAAAFDPVLAEVGSTYEGFWREKIVATQTDMMAAAAATAVGINMTFLFPYSILRKGWTKEFRGLQIFDLSTGMFIPFVLATSCVVIASAAKFHAQPVPGLVPELAASSTDGEPAKPTGKEVEDFNKLLASRVEYEMIQQRLEPWKAGEEKTKYIEQGKADFEALGESELASAMTASPELYEKMSAADLKKQKESFGNAVLDRKIAALPVAERKLAAMLVSRDANRLSQSLAPIGTGDAKSSGSETANLLFGIGVVGMTLSTITLLMLISGFVICEVFNLDPTGWKFRLACLPAALGVLGPFVWSKAAFALAIPTSVFGLMLLPIAYLTFLIMFNQRSLMGKEMPTGGKRILWNVLMGVAASVATVAAVSQVWAKTKEVGLVAIGALLGLALIVQIVRWVRGVKPTSKMEAG